MINLFAKVRVEDSICKRFTSYCSTPLLGSVFSLGLGTYATAQAVRYAAQTVFTILFDGSQSDVDSNIIWMKAYSVTVGFHAANALTLGFLFRAAASHEANLAKSLCSSRIQ